MEKNKKMILDPCCGGRMFWYDKENPLVVFGDIRNETVIASDGRKINISPDKTIDFRNIPFPDNHFKLVVFDPPHLDNTGPKSYMAQKYGSLENTWRDDIKKGFCECMRVLEPYGILIFKWNETRIKTSRILKLIETEPLFGHKSGKQARTHWLCFMKIPTE